MATEIVRLIRDREPSTAASTFTQLLNSVCASSVQCCFMSVWTIRIIRDREPSTATSTLTQLMNCLRQFSSVLLYVHGNHKSY